MLQWPASRNIVSTGIEGFVLALMDDGGVAAKTADFEVCVCCL